MMAFTQPLLPVPATTMMLGGAAAAASFPTPVLVGGGLCTPIKRCSSSSTAPTIPPLQIRDPIKPTLLATPRNCMVHVVRRRPLPLREFATHRSSSSSATTKQPLVVPNATAPNAQPTAAAAPGGAAVASVAGGNTRSRTRTLRQGLRPLLMAGTMTTVPTVYSATARATRTVTTPRSATATTNTSTKSACYDAPPTFTPVTATVATTAGFCVHALQPFQQPQVQPQQQQWRMAVMNPRVSTQTLAKLYGPSGLDIPAFSILDQNPGPRYRSSEDSDYLP